ncbi:MAG: hypothetical protein ABWY56_00790 [Propionibacteriaceae bacterium]
MTDLAVSDPASPDAVARPEAASTPPRRRAFSVAWVVLRVVATAHALMTVSQAVTIGQYLQGNYAMIRLHAIVAGNLILVAALLGVTGVVYVLLGGRVWVAFACAPLFFAEGIQTGMGYSRQLGIHIPLGVAIVTVALVLAVWSWTRAAGRPRARRPRAAGATKIVTGEGR